ncbi:MAG: TolC family protein [Acidobacteria bacterium]|nr:TolC family protein [Acidobacteriota bacterium]
MHNSQLLAAGRRRWMLVLRIAAIISLNISAAGIAPAQESNPQQTAPAGPVLTLVELEKMALDANPTLAQADAAIRAADGRRLQAGLFPNPIIGYLGEELSTRAFSEKSEHYFFFEQTVPLGGKLDKSRKVITHEKAQAEQDAAAQKQRVLNAVRIYYYQALGAQNLVEVRGQLAKLARDAVGISSELLNVGQADRPDMLASEVEAERARLDLIMAENERDRIWQQLGAIVGNPFLKPTRLAGELHRGLPAFDPETVIATMLRDSPQVKRAQAGIERAKAELVRAKAEPSPDLYFRGGIGYSTETLELLNPPPGPPRRTGPEAFVEAGVRIPLFNRNQGGISAATAELEIAEREAKRIELVLRARLAGAFRSYQNSLRVASEYERQIIPRAQRAYELYLTSFKQMAAAYPQVLITQRTLFQTRADYIVSLTDAWQSAIQIQGFLLIGGLDAPGGAVE